MLGGWKCGLVIFLKVLFSSSGGLCRSTPKNLYRGHRARLGRESQGDQQRGVGVARRQKMDLVWLCPKAESCHHVSSWGAAQWAVERERGGRFLSSSLSSLHLGVPNFQGFQRVFFPSPPSSPPFFFLWSKKNHTALEWLETWSSFQENLGKTRGNC